MKTETKSCRELHFVTGAGDIMKSVTIKDNGKLVFKVIRRKCGRYELTYDERLAHLDIEIRDDDNCKVYVK